MLEDGVFRSISLLRENADFESRDVIALNEIAFLIAVYEGGNNVV